MTRYLLIGLAVLLLSVPASAQVTQPLPQSYLRADRLGITFIAYLNNLNRDADTRYQQALTMGAGWHRYPIYWNAVETAPGIYNWDGYDQLVNMDQRNGLKTNAILLGVPGFYGDSTAITGLNAPIFADGTDTPAPGKAINPNHPWARYVYATVNRYRPGGALARQLNWTPNQGITVWEAWNEPDLTLFWRGSQADYARLLQVTYIVVKQADPRAQVMFGGLAYGNPDTNDWLRAVLNIYAQDPARDRMNWYMDIVAVHSYSTPRRTGGVVARVIDTLAAYNLTRPVWVNETGVPVWDDYPGPTWAANNPAQRRLRGTMQQQSAFVIQSAAYAFAAGAEKVFFHQLYDDCGDDGGNYAPDSGQTGDAFGFYRNLSDYDCHSQHPAPGTPRPAVGAFRTLARVAGNARFDSRAIIRRADGSVFIRFGLANSDERLTFLWSEQTTDITIEWQAESTRAQVYAYDNERFTLTPQDATYTVTLPPARFDDDPQRPIGQTVMVGGRTFAMLEQVRPDEPQLAAAPALPAVVTPRAPLPAQVGSILGDGTTGGGTLGILSDITPPITGMTALPDISPPTFTVTWNGSDTGGIERYLVWVRPEGSEWRPWIEAAQTSAEFTGEPGRSYAFAVWAVDYAGNWSLNTDLRPQAQTRIE